MTDTLMTAPGTPSAAADAPATGDAPATAQTPASAAPPADNTPASAAPADGATPKTPADGSEPPKGGDKPTDGKPDSQAPETYELKLPEGSTLDQSVVEKIAAYARERGLSNEDAQERLELIDSQARERMEAQQAEMQRLAFEEWPTQLKADKEFGGEKFDQTAEHARRALNKFGSDALKQALNDTGYGNHPELVKAFARIGRELAEDQVEGGGKGGAGQRSRAERLFG